MFFFNLTGTSSQSTAQTAITLVDFTFYIVTKLNDPAITDFTVQCTLSASDAIGKPFDLTHTYTFLHFTQGVNATSNSSDYLMYFKPSIQLSSGSSYSVSLQKYKTLLYQYTYSTIIYDAD